MSVAETGIAGVVVICGTREACVRVVDCVGSALWAVLGMEHFDGG
jgi:hypothetical protein